MLRKLKAMRWLGIGIIVGAVALGAVSAQAADKYDDRPFSGAMTGTSAGTPTGNDQVDSSSTGNLLASHIGNSTYTIEAHQDYDRHVEEEHASGNCAFVEDASGPGLTITAANGDQIFGNIDDDRSVVCAPESQIGLPMVGDEYYSTLYITVSGGTGRFADASGWLFSEGTSKLTSFNPISGASAADDTGTILGDIDY